MKTLLPPLPSTSNIWKEFGLTVAKWADSTFLYGVGQLASDVYSSVVRAIKQTSSPLNWAYPWPETYENQNAILWVNDVDGCPIFLPQVLIVEQSKELDETKIKVELAPQQFQPKTSIDSAEDFYQMSSRYIKQTARLMDWKPESRTLVFQACLYSYYVGTNLALDSPVPVIGTLREHTSIDGRIELLQVSKLANTTGINGLIFSKDGYMIFQKRSSNVLVRPRELCSGFSGTIEIADVEYRKTLNEVNILREMFEETGIVRDYVLRCKFLGLTRELIRGGAPEMFYSVDTKLSAKEILSQVPRDREGYIQQIELGPFGSTEIARYDAERLPKYFWRLVRHVQKIGNGPISVPFLTNLVLWYKSLCPNQAGIDNLPKRDSQITME